MTEKELKSLIRKELTGGVNVKYSMEDIIDAINNKKFIHTKSGIVYSPVKVDNGNIIGVNNDSEHINVPLEEINLIQSSEERFGR